jgi:hypothetical protein
MSSARNLSKIGIPHHFDHLSSIRKRMAQFGQHPTPEGNLISSGSDDLHEINDLRVQMGNVVDNLDSKERI